MATGFGWCGKVEEAESLAKAGYDFIELPLSSFQLENKEAYEKHMASALASALPVKAFNLFFPGEVRIVGPEVDESRVRNYIALAAQTMARLNAGIVVLGSAGARHIPEGWEQARAREQFLRVLSWCADEMKGTGAAVAIEPLNRGESNFINSVAEGAALAREINRPEVRVLADFYHMAVEHEPLETMRDHREWLAHIHLADTDRYYPGSGSYDYETFVGILQEIDYQGLVSVECIVKPEDKEADMQRAKAFIDRQWRLS